MKLERFFAVVAPYLLGTRDHDSTVRDLYGDAAAPGQPHATDAERLRIYAAFCQRHREDTVDLVFPNCKRVVCEKRGQAAWDEILRRYFTAHPMHHFEICHNASDFAAFLGKLALEDADAKLPRFLADLADLEWWEWQTYVAPSTDETSGQADAGPLRLADTVELRAYKHDLLEWLSQDPRPPAPTPREHLVLYWRDRDLDERKEYAQPHELILIKALVEGLLGDEAQPRAIDEELADHLGIPLDELVETAVDLHQARILLGDPALLGMKRSAP